MSIRLTQITAFAEGGPQRRARNRRVPAMQLGGVFREVDQRRIDTPFGKLLHLLRLSQMLVQKISDINSQKLGCTH